MSHHTWEATYAVKCLREAKRMENLGILGITLFSVRIPILPLEAQLSRRLLVSFSAL
jgi:hypothetical protein